MLIGLKKMDHQEVLPAEYDILEQQMEKALPLSICVRIWYYIFYTSFILLS